MEKNCKKQELRIVPQAGSYKKDLDDYEGSVGVIEVCNDCCRGKLRIQFIDIGNNEALENFNLTKCRFFLTEANHEL